MKLVTFLNVRISIESNNFKEAYKKLCDGMKNMGAVDWQTDNYTHEDDSLNETEERSTEELFGE